MISEQAVCSIERRTRNQALSTTWFSYRTGRVTASTLYDVCHTRMQAPSLSLIKRMCHAQRNKLAVPAVQYGRQKEAEALARYRKVVHELHDNIQFQESGLFISKEHPFLAATPNMLVQCTCYGAGVVEVKCPWKVKDGHLSDLLADPNSCVRECDGALELKTSRRYYYQVQAQMSVCKASYAGFVLWNEKEISLQRIKRDESFFAPLLNVARSFFKGVLLPELVAHWHTSQEENACVQQGNDAANAKNSCTQSPRVVLAHLASNSEATRHRERQTKAAGSDTFCPGTFCVCRGPEEGKMIACDSVSCDIGWFHFKCLGSSHLLVRRVPSGYNG